MSARLTAKRTCVAITLALFAILFVAVPIGSSSAIGGAQAQDPGPAPNEPFADDTVLVGFTAGTSASEKQSVERAVGATDVATIGAGAHVLHVPKGQVEAKIAALKAHPNVRYAEPDYVVHADMTPDDPSYKQLWGLSKVQADQAWNVTAGSQSVVVGDVDTGLDYIHPDLAANVWSNNGTINGCAAGTHGYNALTLTCDPMDDNTASHGTHTAGTIGAVGNNNLGVAGVNWAVSIMGLKFLNSGGFGTMSGAIAAIDWAVRAKITGVNVRVLNNSWGLRG
jgi:subtilisin family serine protease